MENATRALLIAAGVLMGVLILTLGISLFTSLNQYTTQTQQTMEENANFKFNNQFSKHINYYGEKARPKESEVGTPLTIQDIVTAANTAYQNNFEHNITAEDYNSDFSANQLYVQVNLGQNKHLEKNINNNAEAILSENKGKKYFCSAEDVIYSNVTGRIYMITFKELTE